MTLLGRALSKIAADLAGADVGFALVGGLAVSVRTEPRFTRDADLAVAVSGDEEAERVVYGLRRSGYELEAIVEQEATKRLATARLSLRGEELAGVVVDLLFASSGIEPEIVAAADSLKVLAGVELPVATRAHLIALKVLSRDDVNRPQDLVDLRALLEEASARDLESVKEALSLIEERGFHRGRSLLEELDKVHRNRPSSRR